MSITMLYRVEVTVPDEVWEAHSHTKKYDTLALNAVSGAIEAGTELCSEAVEWAIFHTRQEAERCERKLLEMVLYFQVLPITEE